ncbi:hypothetical protein ACVDG9_06010 [Roseibium sp. RP-7]
MKYYLETLDVAQRHSIVRTALRSMTDIRTGLRIPATEELEHGFPFYKNSLRADLINYCNYLYKIDQFFDLDTDLLSETAGSGNDELLNICENFLNSVSSINFAYSRNHEDFKRRLDVYISRHEKDSELEFDGLDSVMDSLNMLSCIFAKVIEDCTKPSSAEPANCFGDNKELLNRCLVEAMDRFGSAAYELFLIEDALDSKDAETKQMTLFRLGARRGIYPVWPEKQLHGGAVRDAHFSDNPS